MASTFPFNHKSLGEIIIEKRTKRLKNIPQEHRTWRHDRQLQWLERKARIARRRGSNRGPGGSASRSGSAS